MYFLRFDYLRLIFNLLDQLQRITGRVLVSRAVCLEFFLVCLGYLTLESIVLVYMSNSMLCFPETFLVLTEKRINPL